MKKLLPAIFILISTGLFAQDYRAYVPGRPAYFHWVHVPYSYNETRAIAEDTVWTSGSHRIVKSFAEEIAGSQWSGCFLFDTTWVGYMIEQDTVTWETWFFNNESDTIRFDPAAGLGQTGFYCRMANGNVMRGIVSSVVQGTVMTVTDSIRMITLNLEDQFGSPLPSDFNGKVVSVTKQFGLLRTYKWSEFPNDTTSYSLYGMENPTQGGRIVTAQQIFDFNIGNRFDWFTAYNPSATQSPTTFYYYSRVITGKTVNGDTVTYNYTEDVVHKFGSTVVSQSWAVPGTFTVVFSVLDSMYEFQNRPYDMIQFPDTVNMWGSSFIYATMEYSPNLYNGRQLKGYYYGGPFYYDTTTNCFNGSSVSWGPCDGYNEIWGEGIGEVYYRGGSATCYYTYQLVYFEKGTETWGTPHNWSVILDVPAQDVVSDGNIVYPNPATDFIFVNFPQSISLVNYQIYNNCGQLVSSGSTVTAGGKAQIPVNQLASGAYSLVFESNGQQQYSRFVK